MANAINIVATFNGAKAFQGVNKLEKSFGQLKKVITAVIGAKAVKEMANFGKEVSLMADRTGLSVAKLTALRGAFVSAGSSAKGFDKLIGNINSGLLGLSIGNGEFAAKLGMLGISPYTAAGRLKDSQEVLYDIADWAKSQKGRMSDQDIMYRLMSWFGMDEGQARLAMGGRESIIGNEGRARSEYRILKDEDAEVLRNLSNSLSELFQVFQVGGAKIVSTFAPAIEGIIEGFKTFGEATEVFTSFMGEHSESIKTIGKGIGWAIGFVIKAITGLLFIVEKIGEVIGKVVAASIYFGEQIGKKLGEKIASIVIWIKEFVDGINNWIQEKIRGSWILRKIFGVEEKEKVLGKEEDTYGVGVRYIDKNGVEGIRYVAPDVSQAQVANGGQYTSDDHRTYTFNVKDVEDAKIIYSEIEAEDDGEYEIPIRPVMQTP